MSIVIGIYHFYRESGIPFFTVLGIALPLYIFPREAIPTDGVLLHSLLCIKY